MIDYLVMTRSTMILSYIERGVGLILVKKCIVQVSNEIKEEWNQNVKVLARVGKTVTSGFRNPLGLIMSQLVRTVSSESNQNVPEFVIFYPDFELDVAYMFLIISTRRIQQLIPIYILVKLNNIVLGLFPN